MPLIIINQQPSYFPPIFEPGYITGEAEVENPYTGTLYGAYGLTVDDYENQKNDADILWTRRQRTFGSGESITRNGKRVPP